MFENVLLACKRCLINVLSIDLRLQKRQITSLLCRMGQRIRNRSYDYCELSHSPKQLYKEYVCASLVSWVRTNLWLFGLDLTWPIQAIFVSSIGDDFGHFRTIRMVASLKHFLQQNNTYSSVLTAHFIRALASTQHFIRISLN